MKKNILTVALSAVLPFSATTSASEPVDIVITAKTAQSLAETSVTSHVITEEQIEQSQATDLTQLIESTSGVNISTSGGRGSSAGTFIRGTSSGQIIVLVDGVRVNSATLGSTDIGHIPLDFIERVEIVKGPLSGLYGADAVGGVIQVFTKKGASASSVELEVGSFGHIKTAASINSAQFRVAASHESSDGIDATEDLLNGNDDEDGFEETAINIGTNLQIGSNSELAISGFFAQNEIEFDNIFATAPADYRTENEINTLSASLRNNLSDQLILSSTLGFTQNNSSTPAYSSQADTDRLSLSTQAEYSYSDHNRVIAGADFYDESIETAETFPVSDRDNLGLFTQYQAEFGNVGSVFNLRYDDNSAYGSKVNGSLGLNVALSPSTRFTASYGTAFRAPTFNELYYPGYGNPDIQPEESDSFEIGVRGYLNTAAKSTQWRVSAYNTTIENLIGLSPEYTAININSAKIKGLELELGMQLSNWNVNSSINLLDATDESTGVQLARRPEQTLQLALMRQFGQLSIGTDLIAERGRYDAGEELNSFERIDIVSSYQISDYFTIAAKIGNVLDEDYQLAKGFNTPGRSFLVNGKYSF